jgi:DNA-binding MarR family transcriptional regulator
MSSSSEPADRPPLAIGALLRFALQDLRERIYSGVHASGFDDLHPAHVTLFRWPGPDGQRPSALAEHVGITKQALNDLLRDLEGLGYITLRSDATDDRARIITLTERGKRLHRTALAVHSQIEEDWARVLGRQRFAQLLDALHTLVRDRPATPMASHKSREPRQSQVNRRTRRLSNHSKLVDVPQRKRVGRSRA